MKHGLIAILSSLALLAPLRAAAGDGLFAADEQLLNGYSEKVSGRDFEYPTCVPGHRASLIVRATLGKDRMDWLTDPAPATPGRPFVAVVWIAALGSSPGRAAMDLELDGTRRFTFHTDGRKDWRIDGEDGASLRFHTLMTDQHGDHHGYMILRLPAAKLKPGKPLKLAVAGHADGLTSWYMTFRKPVRSEVTFRPWPAILKNGGKPRQLVEAGVFHFGGPCDAIITADGRPALTAPLNFGYNTFNLGLDPVERPTKVAMKLTAGAFASEATLTLNPVRNWSVDLIQHTHTDIGYTRSQTEILAEHLRYLDYALDYCDATDSFPDAAKFRWTCEASWPVDEYLKCRPAAQIERLKQRVREGRIETTGMYYNLSELPDERTLASSLGAVRRLREAGLPVAVAMQNDVNGVAWSFNDAFEPLGVKYLHMGTHGHRALICFEHPTLFWWESPSGHRMLAFRAEHYMLGNTLLEIHTANLEKFKYHLLNYLDRLGSTKYPYDEAAIQHSGYITDNSPPSTAASEIVRQWNDLFERPRLTTATAGAFLAKMETRHGKDLPVIRGAWPDWWADGLGASARETGVTRVAAATLTANAAGLSMAATAGIPLPAGTADRLSLTDNALLFYGEHTTGYSESVREPFSQPTMEQRGLKESYAWEANRRAAAAGEEAMGLLQSLFQREPEPSLVVFNTLNWRRSALATIYIDHQIVPRDKHAGIFDHLGKRQPAQALSSRSDGTYWVLWLDDIPAFGYRKYIIRPLDIGPVPAAAATPPARIENEWYRLTLNPVWGVAESWFDKTLNRDLTDYAAPWRLGQFIHETLANREQMESFRLDDFKRKGLTKVSFHSFEDGEVWSRVRFRGESPTAINPGGWESEFRLFHPAKRLDLACSILKAPVTTPESIYVAFPFALEGGRHHFDVPGGVIEAGRDQIPGSVNDWNVVQNFAALRCADAQIVIGSPELPLMQFGGINTGRYKAGALPAGTHQFSWPMNNYWTTNFNADQRGGHSWTYYLTSSADTSDTFATRFGWGCRIPPLTRILPGSGKGDDRWEGEFIRGWPENVLLVAAMPSSDGRSVLLQLRETGGKSAPIKLFRPDGTPFDLAETDATGAPLPKPPSPIAPGETRFYQIK